MRTPAGETPPTLDVSLAATPDYTTRAETAAGDLRNAQQILDAAQSKVATELPVTEGMLDVAKDLGAVARLLRQALGKLSETK